MSIDVIFHERTPFFSLTPLSQGKEDDLLIYTISHSENLPGIHLEPAPTPSSKPT